MGALPSVEDALARLGQHRARLLHVQGCLEEAANALREGDTARLGCLLEEALGVVSAPAAPFRGITQTVDESRLKPHGTWAAYMRHRARREPACDPCREAARVRAAERRASA